MTVSQMECFVEAAITQSLSKAGANLFISQQAVSRQIKALESELGFPVFERHNMGVRLTGPGQIILMSWKPLLAQYRTSIDQAKDMHYGEQKNIKIGILNLGGCLDKITNALFRYNEKYPDLDIEYEILPIHTLLHHLDQGLLHMVIAYSSELEHSQHRELKSYSLFKELLEVGIYVSRYHPLARKKTLTLSDLAGETIGVLSKSASLDCKIRVLNELRKNVLLDKVEIKEYHSKHNLQLALNTGKCVSLMFNSLFEGSQDKLAFYPLDLY